MIIILGSKQEAHAQHIAKQLERIKEEFIFLDTRDYPNNVLIDWIASDYNNGKLIIHDKDVYFKDIKSVYWRNFSDVPSEIFQDGSNTEFLSNIIKRERRSALHSLFFSLDINWVNSMNAFELHKKKAFLTNQFALNKIRVPKTLITNDEEAILRFYEENNKDIIFKPVLGGAFTQKVTDKDLTKENLKTLRISPVQFQECIDGYDIRVYAFKDKIYSAKIDANSIDFREDANAKLTPIELPKKVQKDCLKMMKIADLKYSGIDIRYNPKKKEYVFIEANPAPMFIYAEKVTGFPLTQELINLLVNG